MEACLTQITSSSDTAPRESAFEKTHGPRWIRLILAATILVGLLWRVVRYIGQFPIWGDEAMLLLNILDRDYAGLTQHLCYSQVAPLFFLWLEKTALLAFGPSESAVHFFPFLAGIFTMLIFWRSCRASFAPAAAGFAVAILAVSYYPVRHGCEVKPYAFDLFFAVVFAGLTLGQLAQPGQRRWLAALVVVTPFAVFSSYPSVFVGGAVSLVLLPRMRSACWSHRGLYVLFNLTLVSSFLLHYGVIGHEQIDTVEAQRARAFLRNYWKEAFPPDEWQHWPIWLLKVHTGNMLAYPMGAKNGGSTLTFLLVLLGSVALWQKKERAVLALCWLPFGLNLVAAILDKYPFGDSARITLHLAPFICILAAHGLAFILERISSPCWRTRFHLSIYLMLFVCGLAGIVRDLRHPYKTEHDRETRRLVRDLAQQVAPDEPVVVCHQDPHSVLAEMAWYLRTAPLSLHWLPEASRCQESAKSFWLVLFSHDEASAAEVTACLGQNAEGWRVTESDVRLVPGENEKMLEVKCHKVRLTRE